MNVLDRERGDTESIVAWVWSPVSIILTIETSQTPALASCPVWVWCLEGASVTTWPHGDKITSRWWWCGVSLCRHWGHQCSVWSLQWHGTTDKWCSRGNNDAGDLWSLVRADLGPSTAHVGSLSRPRKLHVIQVSLFTRHQTPGWPVLTNADYSDHIVKNRGLQFWVFWHRYIHEESIKTGIR